MIKYNYFGKEQAFFYEKLENGLDVYIIPNNKQKKYYAEIVVKYGSDIKTFKPILKDKYVTIPCGVAHFLEHKVFDMEKTDPFIFYGKTGTFINASTSFKCTKYYIEGKKSFYRNLEYLINMVFSPYFVDEKVNSEKSIIAEEIKMYDDEIAWQLDMASRENLFKEIYYGNIAGTEESINKIDAKTLQMVYDTFYQASNMILVVGGNIDPNKVLEKIKNNKKINNAKSFYPINIVKEKETKEVVSEYKEIYGNTTNPKLKYSYKFDLNDGSVKDKIKLRLYLNLLFTYLFGDGSVFDEEVTDKKLATSYYYEHLGYDNIYAFSLYAESDYADLFVNLVDRTLTNILIEESDFIRIKKIWYSVIIRSIDNLGIVCNSLVDDIIKNEKIIDTYDYINSLNLEELKEIIKNLDLSNKSLVLLLPNNK